MESRNLGLLLRRVMVITEHARDLPRAILVLPQVNELPFAVADLRMPRMMEQVHAHLDRAVALHGIYLQRAGDEFARHLAADIVLDGVGQGRPAQRDSALIVIELHVLVDQ